VIHDDLLEQPEGQPTPVKVVGVRTRMSQSYATTKISPEYSMSRATGTSRYRTALKELSWTTATP
jgi:hypothetical protein